MKKKRNKEIEIIHEDDELIILNKPADVLSVPDRYNPDLLNLYTFLKSQRENIFIVHRIDRETSGIICFAKTKEAHKNLTKQFSKRETKKVYHTIVQGHLHQKEGTINLPIGENSFKRGTVRIDKHGGKSAITHYKVVEEFKNFSYLEVQIETGRMHQIRVHLEAIGHPLAIDKIYSGKKSFYLSSVKKKYHINRTGIERPIMYRVTLHAHQISFRHPKTEEMVTYTADLHKDFAVMLKMLRKYDK